MKRELGQFYTTNYEYILSNMEIPDDIDTIIEPFVGQGDLLRFIKKGTIEAYDICPKKLVVTEKIEIIQRDTLRNPPSYKDKFVLTNPPYLAKNKNIKDKDIYDKWKCDDLYKCFLKNLISDICVGGIIIVPLNFISSIRKADVLLRKNFLEKYTIQVLNIFEEQVFDDSSYSVCSIYFNHKPRQTNTIKTFLYPSKKCITTTLNSQNNYTIGGEIYNLPCDSRFKIQRATRENRNEFTSNILLKCIDDGETQRLGFKIVDDKDIYIDDTPNLSARSYATLVFNFSLSLKDQKSLVQKMNEYINKNREKYNSLFLTNYRENGRKRISFELAFRICNFILSQNFCDIKI